MLACLAGRFAFLLFFHPKSRSISPEPRGDTVPDVSSSGSPLAQALRCEVGAEKVQRFQTFWVRSRLRKEGEIHLYTSGRTTWVTKKGWMQSPALNGSSDRSGEFVVTTWMMFVAVEAKLHTTQTYPELETHPYSSVQLFCRYPYPRDPSIFCLQSPSEEVLGSLGLFQVFRMDWFRELRNRRC